MTPAAPNIFDSALTIGALVIWHFALWVDARLAVLTQRQEDLHWFVTTGAGCLAGTAALLAIYRHLRAIRRDHRKP